MHDQMPELQVQADESGAWLVALGSFFVVCSLLYFSDVLVKSLDFALLQQSLDQSILDGKKIGTIKEDPNFSRLFAADDKSTQVAISKTLNVANHLENGEYSKANSTFTSKGFPGLGVKSEIAAVLKHLAETEDVEALKNKKEAGFRARSTQLMQDYATVSSELAEYFTVVSKTPADPLPQLAGLPLYEIGVLKDLPMVAGVPDGVKQKRKLNRHLKRQYNKDTENAFETIRTKALQIASGLNTLEEERNNFYTSLPEYSKSRNTYSKRAVELAQTGVLEISRPKMSRTEVWTYNKMRIFLTAYDIRLPQLRSRPA